MTNPGRTRRRVGAVTAVTALVAALSAVGPATAATPAPAPSSPATAPSGTTSALAGDLLLVGGALDENARILRTFVRLADPDGPGPQTAHIAIVTAGSYPAQDAEEAADPEQDNAAANGIYYTELFERFGATTVRVPIDEAVDYPGDPYVPANADDARVAQAVHDSTAVWFGGGDQMRYVRTLFDCEPAPREAVEQCDDTAVMSAVRSVLSAGGAVGGTSAGLTIQQGAAMVTGGQPYEAWRDGARSGYFEGRRLGYVPYGGFGFFTPGLLDSHFGTWSRLPRMARLAMDSKVGAERVVGVDETTAIVFHRDTERGRVIGRHGASIVDLSDAVLTEDAEGPSIEGVHWSYLTSNDRVRFGPDRVRVRRAEGSTTLVGTGPAPPVKHDVWDTVEDDHVYSLRDLAVELLGSAARRGRGVTYEDEPRFRTTLVADHRVDAWSTPRGAVSFDRLEVRIAPCCGGESAQGSVGSSGGTGVGERR